MNYLSADVTVKYRPQTLQNCVDAVPETCNNVLITCKMSCTKSLIYLNIKIYWFCQVLKKRFGIIKIWVNVICIQWIRFWEVQGLYCNILNHLSEPLNILKWY